MDRGDGAVLRETETPASIPKAPAGHELRARTGWRLREALPGWTASVVGAALWALLMAASAFVGLLLEDWQTDEKIRTIALLYALGGAIAFAPGLFAARFVSLGRAAEVRFAAAFLSLALATIGVTALIYAFDYRSYYAEWHAEALSITWAFQLMFTTLGALAQFAVLGLRLYFPLGFVALFLAALWFVRTTR